MKMSLPSCGRGSLSLGIITLFALSVGLTEARAQAAPGVTVTPSSISLDAGSAACGAGSDTKKACLQLGTGAAINKVDVFFLFDDTGSFAGFVPTVTGIFSGLVTDLQTALPGVEFGFGVGRFEDYGGESGSSYSGETDSGRPFTLNQPVLTSASAGGEAALATVIGEALNRSAPGFGGDGPETAIAEGLFQVATGVGFDGNGDALTTGIGGTQVAGSLDAQSTPDDSGDVPAFSTLQAGVLSSGNVGGAGFRSDALKLVILATDICSVAAFSSALGVPSSITGANGVTEPVAEFACGSTTPGNSRFGFVGDSLDSGTNTIVGAVAPLGAATVPQTVAALNSAGIRVMGLVPGGGGDGGDLVGTVGTPSGSGPSFSPNVFLSALARLTDGVDDTGDPLVLPIGSGGTFLKDAIVAAVIAAAAKPVNVGLKTTGAVPGSVTVTPTPTVVPNVGPGGQACFDVAFAGGNAGVFGAFGLQFFDVSSGLGLGSVAVDLNCSFVTPSCASEDISVQLNILDGNSNEQKNLVFRATNLLQKAGGRSRKVAQELRTRAQELYNQNWSVANTVPHSVVSCSQSSLCSEVSHSSLIDQYNQNAKELKNLVSKAVKALDRIGKAKGRNGSARIKSANRLLKKSLKASSGIPLSTTSCSIPKDVPLA